METTQKGWSTLSNISSFMARSEQRKQLQIQGSIDAEIDFTEYLIRAEIHKADEVRFRDKKRKKQLNQDLVRALQTLDIEELICHFNILVDQVTNLTTNKLSSPLQEASSFLITEAYSRSYTLKIWKRKKLRFDRQNHIIYAEKDKKIKIYDLSNYIVRKSQIKDYICIILEAINDVPLEKSKTVHLGFEFKNTFNLWFHNIKISVIYKQWLRTAAALNKIDEVIQLEKEEKKRKENQKIIKQEQIKIKRGDLQFQKNHSHTVIPTREREVNSPLIRSALKATTSVRVIEASSSSEKGEISLSQEEVRGSCYVSRLLHTNFDSSVQQLQYELQRESESLKIAKKKINIHKILLQNEQLDLVESVKHCSRVELLFDVKSKFIGEVSIFQSNIDPTHFKFFYMGPFGSAQKELSREKLLKRLLDPQYAGSINRNIQRLEIKAVIFSENCTINVEEHFPYNKLFRPREFSYLRHLIKNQKGEHFIIDRSIDQAMIPRKQHVVRGDFFVVTKVSQSNHHISLAVDLRISNRGDLLQVQEISHAKKYMNLLALGLSQYFQKQPETSLKLTLYDYDRVVSPEANIVIDPEISIERNFDSENFSHDEEGSMLRIPRANLLLQRDKYMESMFVGTPDQKDIIPIEYIRRTYEPPRKANKNFFNPKLSFMKNEEEHFDWKVQVTPLWTGEWGTNESSGGLSYLSTHLRQRQLKQVLQYVLKATITSRIQSKLSFPVDILAPQSNLERLVKSLAYAPSLFENNLKMTNLKRFKNVILFSILSTLLSLKVSKEFDPILGETYQGEIPSSCKGYAEQINLKQAAVYLAGKDYNISAVIQTKMKTLMNSVTGEHYGVFKVTFSDGVSICFTKAPGELSGLVYGTPTFSLIGKSYFWMEKECLWLSIDFETSQSFCASPQGKSDSFQGIIYQISSSSMSHFISKRQLPDEKDVGTVIEKVQGRWTKNVSFKDEEVDLKQIPLYEMNNEHNSLPSDSSYRDDINCLKMGRIQSSQTSKEALEDQEAYDSKLRERSHHC